ncbi:hypothetical protein HMPREF1230_0283 [Streptococcus pyogenes GA19681]|nr:Transposase [Streptococcus pyogenes MGAS10394]EQL80837.1 hypothetical protein HMPREF1230_0283 [Streptococcus pyogenes GA19681]ESA47852.1 hypothetical protein HMPREF1233_0664 [Streptococcus pyogenes GA19700]BAR43871.1 transposasee [Streptococcus pyogenes JRS4]
MSSDIKWLCQNHPKWHKLRGIGMIRNTIDKDGQLSQENRYFIFSFKNVLIFSQSDGIS